MFVSNTAVAQHVGSVNLRPEVSDTGFGLVAMKRFKASTQAFCTAISHYVIAALVAKLKPWPRE